MEKDPDKRTEYIETLNYRRFRLKDKFDQIRQLLSGSDSSYVELIQTPGGKYSKPKIKKLIDGIITCLEDYRAYKHEKPLSAKERTFFEAYYRLIIGISLYHPNGPDGWESDSGTWNSIIEHVEATPHYDDRAELFRDIICYYTIPNLSSVEMRIPRGIYHEIMTLYAQITGSIEGLISESGIKAANRLMTKEERRLIRLEKENPGILSDMAEKEWEEYLEAERAYYDSIDEQIANGTMKPEDDPRYAGSDVEPDEFEIEYIAEHWPFDDAVEKVVEWKKYFSDVSQLKADCRLVLEQLPSVIADPNIGDANEEAVHLFLARSKVTGWLDDEYFTVYTYLNKALHAAEKKMES